MTDGIAARLFARSKQEGECLVWTGARKRGGYGEIKINYRPASTHRIAWEVANGPIPKGLHVLHSCDNPPCIRHEHLFIGTNNDNIKDKLRKGRQPRGEKHCCAKLTEEQVVSLRMEYALGAISQKAIGEKYGMSPSGVSLIISGKRRGGHDDRRSTHSADR